MNKQLLQKYFAGTCTEEEKQQVEAWLTSDEHEQPLLLPTATKEQYKQLMWEDISADMDTEEPNTRIFPLFNKLTKYAAVACILIVVFFAGRISVPTATAHTIENKMPKDHLYIQGGNGAKGNLPGETFRVGFDGRVRLFNSSMEPKRIQVGEQSFTLEAYSTYFLSGSIEKPVLQDSRALQGSPFVPNTLSGDFSILRTDK
ncbi:MAG: hypothetical protein AAGI38_22395 [Bacteroidota bacterium]